MLMLEMVWMVVLFLLKWVSKVTRREHPVKGTRKGMTIKICEHCKATEHSKDTCFKLHGYPDWYKKLKKDKQSMSGKASINMVGTPFMRKQVW